MLIRSVIIDTCQNKVSTDHYFGGFKFTGHLSQASLNVNCYM